MKFSPGEYWVVCLLRLECIHVNGRIYGIGSQRAVGVSINGFLYALQTLILAMYLTRQNSD